MIHLVSCHNPNKNELKLVTEQCTVIFNKENIDDSKCLCRSYEFSYGHLGSIGNTYYKPLIHCDKIIGYTSYEDVAAFNLKVLNEIKENKCEK